MTAEQDHGQTPATQGSRIDAYVDRYAARATGMVASEIRALFAVASRPEVVSLAGGMPYVTALPLDVVGELVADLVDQARSCRVAVRLRPGRPAPARADLRGHAPGGHPGRRRRRRRHRRLPAGAGPDHPDLHRPGRRGARRGALVRGRAGHLRRLPGQRRARRHGRPGHRARVPGADHLRAGDRGRTGSSSSTRSPTSRTPPASPSTWRGGSRSWTSASEPAILVVEDNPYGLLGFDGEPMRALRADNADGVVYLGSFSKTLAPGFRVGWALAPHAIRDKLVLAMESAVLSHSVLHPARRRRSIWPPSPGASRSRRSGSSTASAATPCSARSTR